MTHAPEINHQIKKMDIDVCVCVGRELARLQEVFHKLIQSGRKCHKVNPRCLNESENVSMNIYAISEMNWKLV